MNVMRTVQFARYLRVSLFGILVFFMVVPAAPADGSPDAEGEVRLSEVNLVEDDKLSISATAAGVPYLVKDIFQGSGYLLSDFCVVDNELFFLAHKGITPLSITELWKSNGTASGTVMVKQFIYTSNMGGNVGRLEDINGTLFFVGYNEVHGEELWKSDGTASGTVMVKDINPGSNKSGIEELIEVEGIAYFRADDGIHGYELWKSDGTDPGTMLVSDINESGESWPRDFATMDGVLYFSADDGSTGHELWRSDGTAPGTEQVKDIDPGSSSSGPKDLIIVDGTLYFSAYESFCRELWKSNGTEISTVPVEDPNQYHDACDPEELTNFNGVLFFRASYHDYELWKSDGSDAGTVRVKAINPSDDSYPERLTVVGDQLYFVADDGTHGFELWKSDGSDIGTVLVRDINVGGEDSYIEQLVGLGSSVFFSASDGNHGKELWISDGSLSGTTLVKDIGSGDANCCGIGPVELSAFSGSVFFTYSDSYQYGELWVSDGNESGTDVLTQIHPNSGSPAIRSQIDAKGTLFFSAEDGVHGRELWKSDSTPAGTKLVKDIDPSIDRGVFEFEAIENIAYFIADDTVHGYELWKSDGTESGTLMVKDIKPGSEESYPQSLINFNGTLYFTAEESGFERGLWKSDGTENGTMFVSNIYGMLEALVVGDLLFISSTDNLWVSDGTETGTQQISDIDPFCLTKANGILYFVGRNSTSGRELWTSDGTETGTVMVKDIKPGWESSIPDADSGVCEFATLGNDLYFFADDGIHGQGLWKSDGSEAGTVLIEDVPPGFSLTSVGDTIYFMASEDYYNWGIWISDGTEIGTFEIKQFDPTYYWMEHLSLLDVFGTLHFVGYDQNNGYELWRSDGTEAGTVMIQDIAPGIFSSFPRKLAISGSHLYFVADDAAHGRELWAMWIGSMGSVSISGDQAGYTGSQYSFTANVAPSDAATPVTYEWQATGQGGETNSGGLSDSASFTWSTPGVKTVTVTASNGVNSVSAEWSINIDVPDVPLASVNLTGAEAGQVGITYDFLAEVSPLDATTPITYEWQATGQSNVTNVGGDSDTVSFSWGSLGEKTIGVTASNGVNSVEAEMMIVIGEEDIALDSLTLTGDAEGLIGGECAFTAEINPLGATTPITYEWQATDQVKIIHTGGVTDTVKFTWNTPGTKIISVTAINAVSQLSKQIEIEIDLLTLHLPIIINK